MHHYNPAFSDQQKSAYTDIKPSLDNTCTVFLFQPCRSLSCQSLSFDKHDSHLRLLSLVSGISWLTCRLKKVDSSYSWAWTSDKGLDCVCQRVYWGSMTQAKECLNCSALHLSETPSCKNSNTIALLFLCTHFC